MNIILRYHTWVKNVSQRLLQLNNWNRIAKTELQFNAFNTWSLRYFVNSRIKLFSTTIIVIKSDQNIIAMHITITPVIVSPLDRLIIWWICSENALRNIFVIAITNVYCIPCLHELQIVSEQLVFSKHDYEISKITC